MTELVGVVGLGGGNEPEDLSSERLPMLLLLREEDGR